MSQMIDKKIPGKQMENKGRKKQIQENISDQVTESKKWSIYNLQKWAT